MEMVCGVIGRGRGGWKGKGKRTDPGIANRMLITPEQDHRASPLFHSIHLHRLLTLRQGLCPRVTGLSSCHIYIFIKCFHQSMLARCSKGVNWSQLPEFCGKDKMHMLLLLQCSVFGNEQSCIVMQTPR